MAETNPALQDQQNQPKEYPILWWTKWFGETREEGRVINNCGLPYTCKFTLDRNKFDESKVIIFHAPSFFTIDDPTVDKAKADGKALLLNTRKYLRIDNKKKKIKISGLCATSDYLVN